MTNQAQPHFDRAKAHFDENDYDAAQRELTEAIRLDPNNALYHAWLGRVYGKQEDSAEAVEQVDRALGLDPNCAMAYYARGLGQQDHDRAIQDYTRAIELDPQDGDAYNTRGATYYFKGDLDRAIQDFSRAIELDSQHALAYHNRGVAYLDKGNLNRSIREYSRAIELDPQAADAYNSRGWSYYEQDDLDRAIEDYSRAIELDPQHNKAYKNRARVHDKEGNLELAIADRARHYQVTSAPRYTEDDKEFDRILETIHDHLTQILLPEARQAGAGFVDYHTCVLSWGRDTSQTWYQGTSYTSHHGRHGFGYIGLTDQALHLVSLGDLSRRYLKGRGLLRRAFFALLRNIDFQSVEKQDRTWTVPYSSITDAQRVEDDIHLATPAETWQLQPIYTDSHSTILTAITMGRAGKLATIWDEPAAPRPQIEPASSSPEETVKLLEQIADLKEKGIITQQEFEEKKKDLLSRL